MGLVTSFRSQNSKNLTTVLQSKITIFEKNRHFGIFFKFLNFRVKQKIHSQEDKYMRENVKNDS